MNSDPALKPLIIASLRAVQAKLWIYEREVELQLGAQDPAVMYEPWISNSEDGAGLLAPIGERLEVKGGWLDAAGIECLDPAKITRSSEIHQVGFS